MDAGRLAPCRRENEPALVRNGSLPTRGFQSLVGGRGNCNQVAVGACKGRARLAIESLDLRMLSGACEDNKGRAPRRAVLLMVCDHVSSHSFRSLSLEEVDDVQFDAAFAQLGAEGHQVQHGAAEPAAVSPRSTSRRTNSDSPASS